MIGRERKRKISRDADEEVSVPTRYILAQHHSPRICYNQDTYLHVSQRLCSIHNSRSRDNFFELIQIDFEEVFVGAYGQVFLFRYVLILQCKREGKPGFNSRIKIQTIREFLNLPCLNNTGSDR